jgi:hypothetical protein
MLQMRDEKKMLHMRDFSVRCVAVCVAAGWGEETDMGELEKCVREIEMDGLLWVRTT